MDIRFLFEYKHRTTRKGKPPEEGDDGQESTQAP